MYAIISTVLYVSTFLILWGLTYRSTKKIKELEAKNAELENDNKTLYHQLMAQVYEVPTQKGELIKLELGAMVYDSENAEERLRYMLGREFSKNLKSFEMDNIFSDNTRIECRARVTVYVEPGNA